MSDGPSLPPPGAPQPPPSSEAETLEKVWWKKWWVITIGVLVVLVVIASIAGGGSEDDDDATVSTDAPVSTEASSTEAPSTEAPSTEAPSTEAPSTEAPSTEAPVSTEAPSTEAPSTEAPVSTEAPSSGDAVDGAPEGVRGDRSSPVSAGTIADIGEGWRLEVLAVIDDGTAAVMEENQFNDPPPEGSRFTLVTVSLGYYGFDDPTSGFMTTISAVGSENVELDNNCGVTPDELEAFIDVFAGGVVTGNVCFITTPADSGVLQLFATTGFFGGPDVFLDASVTPESPAAMPPLRGAQAGSASADARLSPVPIGTPTDVGEGWQFSVTTPAQDITDAVLAENQFNDPPPEGYRFVGIGVSFDYSGDGSASAFEVTVNAVGDSNVALPENCGVIPGEADLFNDVFAGGSATGTLCFVTPAEDIGTVVLYASALFDDDYSFIATL